jgi:hypothetical protein
MLEPVEAAFDQMPFLVERVIEREGASPGRVRGDDGGRLLGIDCIAKMSGIVSGVSDHNFGRQALDQLVGLGDVVSLPGTHPNPHRIAEAADRKVDFAAQAAARAPDSLILSPPFAPAACW